MLQRCLVVCTIILGMGVHWDILQSVAWTGMVITYSNHSSLGEALKKTFDGKHPCALCKVVKAGQQSERNQGRQKLLLKLDPFVYGVPPEALYPRSVEAVSRPFLDLYCPLKETPPTPPPILA